MQASIPAPSARAGAILVNILLAYLSACGGQNPSRPLNPDWLRTGKLAGLEIYHGISDAELSNQLNALVDQHVDVAIADSSLSGYKTDDQFQRDLELISRVANAAHGRGLRVVWYLTTLEVQTVGGRNKTSTMAKDHPDWLQVGIEGEKNVFYGGQEDWVEADDESAWLCPRGPYRDYFLARIRKLAASGIDGIWADVPLFMDTGVKWSCHCEHHQKHFQKLFGKPLPKKEDWNDLAWREWINYRHHELNDFIMAIHGAARDASPEVEVVIEIFTTDYNDAMDKGLDGTFTGAVEGLSKVWEIDSVSNLLGMRYATADDWLSKIAMTKFARGADKGRPTWVFSYGNEEWDAEMVMAIAFASQANPYETKTPEMADTVGAEFRKQMYGWADENIDAIYDSSSAAKVAVLYSSLSRDYLDHYYGFAMYSSTDPPIVESEDLKTGDPYTGYDKQWWSDEVRDSATQLEFLGEYRGMVKAMAHLHVPFAIEVLQKQSLDQLQRYETLIAPSLAAVSDDQAKLLRDYVREGGQLIITGLDPTGLNEYGTRRSPRALADLLSFDEDATLANGDRAHHFGSGCIRYVDSLLGLRYFRIGSDKTLQRIQALLNQTTTATIQTDADPMIYVDLYQRQPEVEPAEMVLHLINLSEADGSGKVPSDTKQVQLSLALPPDTEATAVRVSSPDEADDAHPTHQQPAPGLVSFTAKVSRYAIARVTLTEAATVGALEVKIAWPDHGAKNPPLGAYLRVEGEGLLGPRTRYGSWGDVLKMSDLPVGKKQVEIVTVDGRHHVVGRLRREVTIAAGKTATLSPQTGLTTAGPTTLALSAGDEIFATNDTNSEVSVTIGGAAPTKLAAGQTLSHRFADKGSVTISNGPTTATIEVKEGAIGLEPKISAISHEEGFAGHSVKISGESFGHIAGSVKWGDQPCTVTSWMPNEVVAYLPHDAAPSKNPLSVEVASRRSNEKAFNVLAPDIQLDDVMQDAFTFVRDKLRSPAGGVYSNFKDRVDPPGATVYPYGHHQTAEHLGLILWVSAALLDHEVFELAYRFLIEKVVSPRRDVVNWAIHKETGKPMVQQEAPDLPWLNSNAPLDDFRVVKGLVAGWQRWKDERYRLTALRIGRGLYETSVSRPEDFDKYPGGLVAYAYNWPEEAGLGVVDIGVIPVDYADLWTMRWLSEHDKRWLEVIDESIKLMEAAQIPSSGQFYNSFLQSNGSFSGDFEYRDTIAGQKIKAIQSLWIALHLARVGRTAAAKKALNFYKDTYSKTGRISEYLNPDGTLCEEPYFNTTMLEGEPRIYAQAARLAYYLGDKAFGDKVIAEKIVPDRDTTVGSPTFGSIGVSSAGVGDAEAWNNLEPLLALAQAKGVEVVGAQYKDTSK